MFTLNKNNPGQIHRRVGCPTNLENSLIVHDGPWPESISLKMVAVAEVVDRHLINVLRAVADQIGMGAGVTS